MKPQPEPAARSPEKTSRALETPRTSNGGTPSSEAAPLPVPDHTLVRRIGKGSYGEVWLARNALGTWRAVKIVRRSVFDADRPYEREFAGIQRFEPISRSHESQLNILQVGQVDDGFYYVMELADDMGRGQDIEEATYKPRDLRSELHLHGRLPVSDCLRLGLALTTALEHLHKHGLVHRDIKPSNIVFVKGNPKLADIGLVAQAEATMSFVGTEGFVPPEGPGTPQADIYSLGKVLYELSTGHDRHQFPELPTGLEAMPDGDQLGELNEVLLRACQRNPAQRYQTAAEMHADLALLDSGRSVVRLRGIERRLRLIQRAGAAVSAFAILVAAGWWWQARQTSIVRSLVSEKSLLAEEKTKLADSNQRLADENRRRIVRLGVANGVSLMDQGDPAGALLWFANALAEVTNTPEESIHRIRIQQVLNQMPRPLRVLPPEIPAGWVSAWSPDGRRIATAAFHGRTAVWDAESGAPLWKPITLPFDQEWSVQFTSDGRQFWVHGQNTVDPTGTREYDIPTDSLSLIDTETGEIRFTVSGPKWEHLEFSPKDRWFAFVDKEHGIHLHNASDGKEVAQMRGHTNQVVFLQFSPQGDRLASTGADGSLRLWQLPAGQMVGPPLQFGQPLRAVRFRPDGEDVALAFPERAGGTNLVVEFWNAGTGKRIGPAARLAGTRCEVLKFLGSGGERLFFATESANGVFATRTGEQLPTASPIDRSGTSVYSFSPDDRFIAFGGQKGLIGLWSLETGRQVFRARLGGRDWTDFNFSADGSKILGARDDGVAVQVDGLVPRGFSAHRLSTPIGWQGHDARRWLSDDRRRLLLRRDGSFSVVDLDRLTDWKVPQPDVPFSYSVWAAIAPQGQQFAIHYNPKEPAHTQFVELWREAENGWNRLRIQVPAGVSSRMGFSPDGTLMITPGEEQVLQFWNTSNGTLERSTTRVGDGIIFRDGIHRFAVVGPYQAQLQNLSNQTHVALSLPVGGGMHTAGVAVSPSGECIALESGGTSEEKFTYTYLLSTSTGRLLAPVLEHGGPLHYAEFSPDGRRLFTTGLTPYVRVWDARTGDQLMQLDLGNQPLRTAQWSLDGRFIVARSDEKTVRVWDAATGEAVTPILGFADQVRYAILGQGNRLIVFSQPDLISVWELKECSLPVDVVADYARYLSGRYLNANGALAEIKPKELADLGHSLRQRAPDLFE